MMLYFIHFFLYVRKPFQHYGCGGFVRHCTLQNFNQKNIVGEILARLGQMERIDILDKDLTYTVDNRYVIKQITNLLVHGHCTAFTQKSLSQIGPTERKYGMDM